MLVVLTGSEPRRVGESFRPVALSEPNGWKTIDPAGVQEKFPSNGRVYNHIPKNLAPNHVFVAEVEEKYEFFQKDPEHFDLYQLQSTVRDLAEVVSLPMSVLDIKATIPYAPFAPYSNKPILLQIDSDRVLGPYTLVNKGTWYANAVCRENKMNVYSATAIINGPWACAVGHSVFVDLEMIQPVEQVPCFSDEELIRWFLKSADSALNPGFTRREQSFLKNKCETVKELTAFFDTLGGFPDSTLLKLRERVKSCLDSAIKLPEIQDSIVAALENQPEVREKRNALIEQQYAEHVAARKEQMKQELLKTEHNIARAKGEHAKREEQLEAIRKLLDEARSEFGELVKHGKSWYDALYNCTLSPEKPSHDALGKHLAELDTTNAVPVIPPGIEDLTFALRGTLNRSSLIRIEWASVEAAQQPFDALGHRCVRLTVHADASWLTPSEFYEAKGVLGGFDGPVGVGDFIRECSKAPAEFIPQLLVLGANRAPLDGYAGPLVKALTYCNALAIDGSICTPCSRLAMILQMDDDPCVAPVSAVLEGMLSTLPTVRFELEGPPILVPHKLIMGES